LDYGKKTKNKKNPVQGLLFFSAIEIYGDPDKEIIQPLKLTER